jgi:hypothetical protein
MAMVECLNCGQPLDPTRYRWRCPACGMKDTCCEGEPCLLPAPPVSGLRFRSALALASLSVPGFLVPLACSLVPLSRPPGVPPSSLPVSPHLRWWALEEPNLEPQPSRHAKKASEGGCLDGFSYMIRVIPLGPFRVSSTPWPGPVRAALILRSLLAT